MINVRERLAASAMSRTQDINKALAEEIVATRDRDAVASLAGILANGNGRDASNAASVLGEIGNKDAHLLIGIEATLAQTIQSGTGKPVWESMTGLAGIAQIDAKRIIPHLAAVRKGMNGDSVIARDKGVMILASVARLPDLHDEMIHELANVLSSAPVNQLPTYAEATLTSATADDVDRLIQVLAERLSELVQPAKNQRILKVIAKLEKLRT